MISPSLASLRSGEPIVLRATGKAGSPSAVVSSSAAELSEAAAGLVDLSGQRAHQSLLPTRAQRHALDRFGAVDHTLLVAARGRVAELEDALGALGGDPRARAREVDLLRFQLAEI